MKIPTQLATSFTMYGNTDFQIYSQISSIVPLLLFTPLILCLVLIALGIKIFLITTVVALILIFVFGSKSKTALYAQCWYSGLNQISLFYKNPDLQELKINLQDCSFIESQQSLNGATLSLVQKNGKRLDFSQILFNQSIPFGGQSVLMKLPSRWHTGTPRAQVDEALAYFLNLPLKRNGQMVNYDASRLSQYFDPMKNTYTNPSINKKLLL